MYKQTKEVQMIGVASLKVVKYKKIVTRAKTGKHERKRQKISEERRKSEREN